LASGKVKSEKNESRKKITKSKANDTGGKENE
jgi:hypothetical protein